MRMEALSMANLREGIFCAAQKPAGEEMYDQLGLWLDGGALRGMIARADSGEVSGFVLYYPIDSAPLDVEGEGLYVVQCVHVKSEFRGSGVGRLLVESAVADARANGASGLVVEGQKRNVPGAFFSHLGMIEGPSQNHGTLYYYSFDDHSQQPRYMTPTFAPRLEGQKIRIDIFDCRSCHLGISNRQVVETVLESIGPEKADVVIHDQNTRQAIVDKGMSAGMFVDGKLTFFGGPISEDNVMDAIEVAMSARERATDR